MAILNFDIDGAARAVHASQGQKTQNPTEQNVVSHDQTSKMQRGHNVCYLVNVANEIRK